MKGTQPAPSDYIVGQGYVLEVYEEPVRIQLDDGGIRTTQVMFRCPYEAIVVDLRVEAERAMQSYREDRRRNQARGLILVAAFVVGLVAIAFAVIR